MAYIWGLLTNRTLSIHITKPCPLSQLLIPNEIDWEIKPIENLDDYKFNVVQVNKMDRIEYYEEFKNLNLIKMHEDQNLIILRTNLDLIKSLAENSALQEKLVSLGIVDNIENFKMSSIFRIIYNQLFKLTPKLEEKYNNFKIKAKPNNSSKLFCAQVRIGSFGFDREFTFRNNSKLFWNFIRKSIIKDEKNYKLFVTTDTETVASESLKEFGEDKVIMIDGYYNHIDKSPPNNTNCEPFEKTILDLHAFQLCDKVVGSRGGYGMMGDFLRENPFDEYYRYTEVFDESKNKTSVKFIKIKNLKILEENIQNEIEWVKTHP